MTLMTCAAVQRRLQAFYDRELQVADLIVRERIRTAGRGD